MMKLNYILGGSLLASASAFQSQPSRGSVLAYTRSRASKPLAALVNIDCKTAERDIGSMDEWATNYGVQRNFQLVCDEDGTDWSATAAQDLQAGSPVLIVPANLILSSTQARAEFGENTRAAEEQLTIGGVADQIPLFSLFVKILVEYEMGDQSPYYQWLNSLPRRFDNGASMTYACLECLPPYVAWLSMKEQVNLNNFRNALRYVSLDKKTVHDKNLAKWAYSVAVTRSFDVDGEKKIVPMADMFNHGTETELEISYDGEGNCHAFTTTDVPAGSPLRMSYGDPTNPSPFFSTYGFLDETSPASFCKLMNLQQEMEAMGLDYSRMLFYKDTGEISEEVWDLMLYQVLSADQNLQQGFYQAYVSGDIETKSSYHQEYYSYTSHALKEHVEKTLTQLDKLSDKAYTRSRKVHPRIPLILRHNAFVKSTFLKVKAVLDA